MKRKRFFKSAATLILLILLLSFTAGAEYIILTELPENVSEDKVFSGGADGTLTFWEAPIYFKWLFIEGYLSYYILSLPNILPLLLAAILCYLGNNNRKKIVSFVSDYPGCQESEILVALNMKRGTFRYHMDKLLKANLINSAEFGQFTRYFPSGMDKNHSVIDNDAFLKNSTRMQILDAIFKNPGITGKDLSTKFELDKSTIHWHVSNLDKSKLIQSEKDGKYRRYYPEKNLHTSSEINIPNLGE